MHMAGNINTIGTHEVAVVTNSINSFPHSSILKVFFLLSHGWIFRFFIHSLFIVMKLIPKKKSVIRKILKVISIS